MHASATRLLGAAAPNTDAGTKYGATPAAASAEPRLRNSRRDRIRLSPMSPMILRSFICDHSTNGLPPFQVSSMVRSSVGSVTSKDNPDVRKSAYFLGANHCTLLSDKILLADTATRCVPGTTPSAPS